MKTYKFRYSVIVWVLSGVVALLAMGGLVWNIFNLIEYTWAGTFKIVTYSLLIALNIFLFVFVISVMVYGRYVIKNENIYLYFGFIRTKVRISDIVNITHFKKSNKLVMYFNDDKYSVVVISPLEFDDFIAELRKINPKIEYDWRIDGEDTPEQ